MAGAGDDLEQVHLWHQYMLPHPLQTRLLGRVADQTRQQPDEAAQNQW